ncbi:MAG: YitT family protein [Oscillospiraceae bacterium]
MRGKWKKYTEIIIGAIIMGFALDLFLVPAQITAGGVGGVATILNHLFQMPISLLIIIINIPLFVVGALNFKMDFLYASILGTGVMSISAEVFTFLSPLTNDIILSSVFGGASYGFGLGMVLLAGGTTGGTDILAVIFKKHFPHISVGQFFLIIDGLVIISAGIAFKRWDTILYSTVTLLVCSRIVDMILEGVGFAKMVYIISEKNNEIAGEIYKKTFRGVTGLSGVSMYNGNDKRVLMCVIRKYELVQLKKIIKDIDKDAFVIITEAKEVLGLGFKDISIN